MKNHFGWKSTGKMFPKAPVQIEGARAKARDVVISNRIAIKKMFDEQGKSSLINCLQ